MPVAKKVCRVCGKTYEACRTPKSIDSVFRWQDVSCSPECGAKYLHDVMVSRGQIQDDTAHVVKDDNGGAKPSKKTRKPSVQQEDFDNA